jgi:hypothetical protein
MPFLDEVRARIDRRGRKAEKRLTAVAAARDAFNAISEPLQELMALRDERTFFNPHVRGCPNRELMRSRPPDDSPCSCDYLGVEDAYDEASDPIIELGACLIAIASLAFDETGKGNADFWDCIGEDLKVFTYPLDSSDDIAEYAERGRELLASDWRSELATLRDGLHEFARDWADYLEAA